MLGLVIANQRTLDSFDARLTAQVAHGGEHSGISLSCDNGTDDPHTGGAGDVTHHMLQLQVHVS
ncbi:hypothetical protein D3C73_1347090 [compost metagenome]